MDDASAALPLTPVCAIGASAGGIAALREFFRHVGDDLGIAFVVVIHLSPDHPSQLSEILANLTSMPVEQVEQKARLQPNHIYVIPPDRELVIEGEDIAASTNHIFASRIAGRRCSTRCGRSAPEQQADLSRSNSRVAAPAGG